MWKSEDEMRAVVSFVWYEWEMFSWGMSVIRSTVLVSRDPDNWNVGTGDQEETKDALIEVTLLHARALRDFLGRDRKELKQFEQTDIVAGDFFDKPGGVGAAQDLFHLAKGGEGATEPFPCSPRL